MPLDFALKSRGPTWLRVHAISASSKQQFAMADAGVEAPAAPASGDAPEDEFSTAEASGGAKKKEPLKPGEKTPQYPCSTCCRQLVRAGFSTRQWKHGVARRCHECVAKIEAGGAAAAAAVRDHKLSRGRVDGHKHRKAGKLTCDRAARATKGDTECMMKAVEHRNSYQRAVGAPLMGGRHGGLESDVPCFYVWLQPRAGWDFGEGYSDFITTLRQGLCHEQMQGLPTEDANAHWPENALMDAPYLSAVYKLRFTCDRPDRFHVSSMPRDCITRHTNGTLLLSGKVPVFGRISDKLEAWVKWEMVRAYRELQRVRLFRRRGAKCCSISVYVKLNGYPSLPVY